MLLNYLTSTAKSEKKTEGVPKPSNYLVDSHLVMNVLNNLAAEDYTKRETENLLLFALSDYLREVFYRIDRPSLSLFDEIKSLRVHVNLLAEVSGWKVSYSINNTVENTKLKVVPGCLVHIFNCLLNSFQSHPGASWALSVNISDERALPDQLIVKIDLQNLNNLGWPELYHAEEQLINLTQTKIQSIRFESIKIMRESLDHLRMECHLRALEN